MWVCWIHGHKTLPSSVYVMLVIKGELSLDLHCFYLVLFLFLHYVKSFTSILVFTLMQVYVHRSWIWTSWRNERVKGGIYPRSISTSKADILIAFELRTRLWRAFKYNTINAEDRFIWCQFYDEYLSHNFIDPCWRASLLVAYYDLLEYSRNKEGKSILLWS